MKIVGIDPGTVHIGCALLLDGELVEHLTMIKPLPAKAGVVELSRRVIEKVKEWSPDIIAMEDYAPGGAFNVEEAEVVGMLYSGLRDYKFMLLAPTTVKAIFAKNGKADKKLMMKTAEERWKQGMIYDHEADACAIADCCRAYFDGELDDKKTRMLKSRIFKLQ